MDAAPSVAVVVPRRPDGGRRDLLWAFCRPQWEQFGWPIIESEDLSGPFNRSAAINAGVARSDAEVILVVDGDVVIEAGQVVAAVERAADSGRLVLAYSEYVALTERFTDRVIAGFDGDWRPGCEFRMHRHVSSVLALPRHLFDRVGGFDERFVGWGWDDVAFHAACKAAAGVERVPGTVWHLCHPPAVENDPNGGSYRSTPAYVAGAALAQRYCSCDTPEDVERVAGEDRGGDQVVAVVLTTGTRSTLEATIESFDSQVTGPVGRRLIVVDGATRPRFDGWDVVNVRAGGFGAAVAAGTRLAVGSGQPWVFWCEDDFTFNRPVDLRELQAEMDAYPDLAQLSLMRQAWYPHELAAGGVVEAKPAAFTARGRHLRQRDYWTTNPHLTRRLFLAANEWPQGRWSEATFAQQVFEDAEVAAGVWGDGTPWVTHIGVEKAGTGY